MPAPFKQIKREQFAGLLAQFKFKRQINAVHMHHTWRPNHNDYDSADGHRTIVGMYLYHTQQNGWQDIAQHVTVAPDGTIWLGRNWNLPPASASGHNGNLQAGPFMFEIIGNFDKGFDKLEGEQLRTTIEVIARLQQHFGLVPTSLHFHNSMSTKSCPGTGVVYADILAAVTAFDFSTPKVGTREVGNESAIEELIRSLGNDSSYSDPPDAEIDHDHEAPGTQRGSKEALPPEAMAELRPHLVNLNFGRFSTEGELKTEPGDVDAIFDVHLEQALREARAQGLPLRIAFYAHGGLVKESLGLAIAHKHLLFWKKNGVYPINFVWETGLFETLGQLLRRSKDGTRGIISDVITDPIIEAAARVLGGPKIWGGMKLSAERSVEPTNSPHGEGGAYYVAKKLKAFCDRHKNDTGQQPIELHAVGHSAGSIFHAHFISTALDLGVPAFNSLQLLAPAVRVDTFKRLTVPRLGNGIDRTTIFTMTKDYERNDNCATVYRKSLLYLIYYSLEPERKEAILGLEKSLRADAELAAKFGLTGKSASGDVVFAVTPIHTGRSASTSTTHGGFDDDAPTLGSVVRRIVGKQDADPIEEYHPGHARAADPWFDQLDWPEESLVSGESAAVVASTPISHDFAPSAAGNRRLALCIGIDDYPTAPLAGCVADTSEWSRIFEGLAFEVQILKNAQASRAGILHALQALISGAHPGDVLILQYSGHGTTLDDLDGDEDDGKDEALCPHDFASGAFLIDDDIRDLFSQLPNGVNLTCFFDCCHSGTNTRFAASVMSDRSGGASDQRRRFMPATAEMQQKHRDYRAAASASPAASRAITMSNISFAACQDSEVAWESNGHGDFTVRAGRIFAAGIGGLTNEQFQERVLAEFGRNARQNPRLDCRETGKAIGFLQPLVTATVDNRSPGDRRGVKVAQLNTVLQSAVKLAQEL